MTPEPALPRQALCQLETTDDDADAAKKNGKCLFLKLTSAPPAEWHRMEVAGVEVEERVSEVRRAACMSRLHHSLQYFRGSCRVWGVAGSLLVSLSVNLSGIQGGQSNAEVADVALASIPLRCTATVLT